MPRNTSHSFRVLFGSIVCSLLAVNVAAAPTLNSRSDSFATSNFTSLVARAPAPISLPLIIIDQDTSYVASIAMGASGKTFNVIVDTGTPVFWLLSETSEQLVRVYRHPSACSQLTEGYARARQGQHNGIGPTSSSTFDAGDKANEGDEANEWGFTYMEGSTAVGFAAHDKLTIGGVSLDDMPFGVAETITGELVKAFEDGIMGFAPRTAGTAARSCSAGTNPAKFDESTLVEVDNFDATGNYWMVSVSTVKIDGEAVISTELKAVVDTGTSDIRANPAIVKKLLAKIPGVQQIAAGSDEEGSQEGTGGDFLLPCDTESKLAFTIGGKDWDVDPRDLALPDERLEDNMCFSQIFGDPSFGEDTILLGATFLKNVYLSLNLETKKIGFAKPK
ncbi:hypothetical protein EVG20_g3745 [Dentipellis fragilis]|uniref:Peptidase A1 domain-containing protein n=1 Tax=Dentipellis fragilis TaxID=205917 RepID=A0A4Y9YZZ5_9AGAM|nr:hypothetical protein EVG20_g3745 [Dentipellis fragilis]